MCKKMEKINNTMNNATPNFFLEKLSKKLSSQSLPKHIGIIMDGNSRWAHKNGVSIEKGYQTGAKNLRKIISACTYFQIPTLSIYAFSTENWNRSKNEVAFLMSLLKEYSEKYLPQIEKENICFRLLGDFTVLPIDISNNLVKTVQHTKKKTGLNLCLAVNYGGRNEIVRAVNKIIKKKQKEPIKENEFSQYLDTAGLSDVDLVIRTSGEQRISNFLLWQSAYAEFYFCTTLWPDFDEKEFFYALINFSQRTRTKGVSHAKNKN